MMLGLGLSLTNIATLNRSSTVPSNTPEQLITAAIQRGVRISAKIDGKASVLEVYALYRASGKMLLRAVVVYSERRGFRKFQIKEFEIGSLSNITVTDDKFFANWAFDVRSIAAEHVIASVELVEYIEDRQQTNAS